MLGWGEYSITGRGLLSRQTKKHMFAQSLTGSDPISVITWIKNPAAQQALGLQQGRSITSGLMLARLMLANSICCAVGKQAVGGGARIVSRACS